MKVDVLDGIVEDKRDRFVIDLANVTIMLGSVPQQREYSYSEMAWMWDRPDLVRKVMPDN
jgi:hypothetical protein